MNYHLFICIFTRKKMINRSPDFFCVAGALLGNSQCGSSIRPGDGITLAQILRPMYEHLDTQVWYACEHFSLIPITPSFTR